MSTSHYIGLEILIALSNVLGMEGDMRFESFHNKNAPSNCALGLNMYPKRSNNGPNLGHNAHTDVGSITLLFCSDWGLQVQSQEPKKWAYVTPREGHAIVNVADSLRFLSGSRLRSCLHRVVPHARSSEDRPRYSFAYFLRPDRNAILKDASGNEWTAQQWQESKYINFRQTHEVQRTSSLQTGEKGVLGLWDGLEEGVST